jgi:phage terminase large subunit-like protein
LLEFEVLLATQQDEQKRRRQINNKLDSFYPETGNLRRELYPKHCSFFAAGATHNERLAICGNRVGKSEGLGAYEVAIHLTGNYPHWWVGRRFDRPIDAWVAGKTGETTRDIVQGKLLGKLSRMAGDDARATLGLGTGMIPREWIIGKPSPKSGISDAIDTAWIQHVSGGRSALGFKSYGKDRDAFEGTEKDLIWLDEEPPADVYDECGIRLMATKPGERNGLMLVTFTPLAGYSEVVKNFLESEDPSKFFIKIGWNDAPHLSEEVKTEMRRKYAGQPHLLKTRELGEPGQGEGAIYPVDLESLLIDPFDIPSHWPRGFGMDVGKTAVVWGALDKPNDTLYLYREYYSEEYNPALHAFAIKGQDSKDQWIPGFIDPGSLGSSQVDGQKLFRLYKVEHRLNISTAVNGVESGLMHCLQRMQAGRLKVFSTMPRWQKEFLRYHRMSVETLFGIGSKVVKKDDHLMDATRYLHESLDKMIVKPSRPAPPPKVVISERGWMA